MRKVPWLFVALNVWFLMCCGPLSASTADGNEDRLETERYRDPKGYFSVVPPQGWKTEEYPQDPRGKVTFIGPEPGVDLRVLVNLVDFEGIDELTAFCENAEARIGTDTHIREIVACGRPAVRRTFDFRGLRMHVTDLMVGKADHNLQYAALPEKYDRYLPVILKSIETYEPAYHEFTGAEVAAHGVAKKLRLAQALRKNGKLYLALEEIGEGLEISPENGELLKMKREIEEQIGR